MRWRGRRTSSNIEDRRGQRPAMGRPVGIGCGGLLLVAVFAVLTGADPFKLLQMFGGAQGQAPQSQLPPGGGLGRETSRGDMADEMGTFVSTILADTEETWGALLPQLGQRYQEPRLVLFTGQVASACGFNSSAVGPFYCPADRKVYLDTVFFRELAQRFGAPGDFAQAYVIAHEIGHHVQNLLGISDQVRRAQARVGRSQANDLSVRLELQADCLAGVWANHAHRHRNLLEPGDVEEGLRAAAAIGDDQIQRRTQGYTVPESWTHGSSEQRQRWFAQGLQTGDPSSCETFDQRQL